MVFLLAKHFVQFLHWYGKSLGWVAKCLSRRSLESKTLSQYWHVNSLSILCFAFFLWFFRPTCRVNLLSQTSHWNNFTPIWCIWCNFRAWFSLNVLSHLSHANGRSPVWTSWCFFRLPDFENTLSQIVQGNWSSFRWTALWWVFRLLFLVKYLSHWSHLNGLTPKFRQFLDIKIFKYHNQ